MSPAGHVSKIGPMNFSDSLVVIRGGGDLATGVAYRLHKVGFAIIVLELSQPMVVRRTVALASAVMQGTVQVEDIEGRLMDDPLAAAALARTGVIPVMVSPTLPNQLHPSILIDARMAKRNIDTSIGQAPLVIALGPGFAAGTHCHAVIETKRGHTLGRVIWQGTALPNTGTPGIVAGKGAERVIRAPASGEVSWLKEIGDVVEQGDRLGDTGGMTVAAPFRGVIRGLIAPGTAVPAGMKIGDLDARMDLAACFTISDKALAIGGGVLEAVLSRMPISR